MLLLVLLTEIGISSISISMSGRTTRSLRAGRNNCLRLVHVAVTRLKFGLQLDRKPRKIDQVPSDEFPGAVWRTCSSFAWGVLKPDHEMHCVIPHFIGRLLRLEIKRPKTAVATSGSVKLRVQIEHAFGFQIDDAQIRISILSRATPVPIAASRGPALPIVSTMRSAPRSATLASIAAKVSFSFGYGFCLSRPGRPLKE